MLKPSGGTKRLWQYAVWNVGMIYCSIYRCILRWFDDRDRMYDVALHHITVQGDHSEVRTSSQTICNVHLYIWSDYWSRLDGPRYRDILT